MHETFVTIRKLSLPILVWLTCSSFDFIIHGKYAKLFYTYSFSRVIANFLRLSIYYFKICNKHYIHCLGFLLHEPCTSTRHKTRQTLKLSQMEQFNRLSLKSLLFICIYMYEKKHPHTQKLSNKRSKPSLLVSYEGFMKLLCKLWHRGDKSCTCCVLHTTELCLLL